ncbi:Uncharacterised protein [Anaerostipes hadrus]|uniref:Uncharacterized protein n=1 Tax=Anaerostipes hadrus TaxID=649756 RepID=A0A173U1G0_ANAHA|nr:hypothetical protein [Anaerostipes hadrus]CUN08176.1 Uncharacterised protein [Anaerostipes hadrus]
MRQIANNVYIPVLKDLVEEGKEVSMMISGSSMNPFFDPSKRLYFDEEARRRIESWGYGVFSEKR